MGRLAEIVLSHQERAVVCLGDVFIKCDTSQERAEREIVALHHAPVPTPEVLWYHHAATSLIALTTVRGRPLLPHDDQALWSAAGATARRLHDAPTPVALPGPMRTGEIAAWIDDDVDWLAAHTDLAPALINVAKSSAAPLRSAERMVVSSTPWRDSLEPNPRLRQQSARGSLAGTPRMTGTIEVLSFDADGTLWDFDATMRRSLAKALDFRAERFTEPILSDDVRAALDVLATRYELVLVSNGNSDPERSGSTGPVSSGQARCLRRG